MIPTLFLVGLLAGILVGHRSRRVLVVGVLASLAWGLVVADQGAFVSGTLLAVPNVAAGALIGLGGRTLVAGGRQTPTS